MSQAQLFCTVWQALLLPFAWIFIHPGYRRFVQWITALALNTEKHTITGSVLALDRPEDWKALEHFAETGAWHTDQVAFVLAELVEQAPGRFWHGYRVWAVDDTKVHRGSPNVWGTCTFHEYTARCPNRPTTVRAHNWVVLGALLHNPDQPAWFLPMAGLLYFRKGQLPRDPNAPGGKAVFRTKCELAVELLRQRAQPGKGRHLAVFDGGYALKSVVRPLVLPDDGSLRIAFVIRLRHDARLDGLPPAQRRKRQRGPTPRWGPRLPATRQGGRWAGP